MNGVVFSGLGWCCQCQVPAVKGNGQRLPWKWIWAVARWPWLFAVYREWKVSQVIIYMNLVTWGNDPIWRSYFSDGLKLETTQLVIKISIDQSVKWNVMTQMLHRTGVWKLYLHGRWKRASLNSKGKSGVNKSHPMEHLGKGFWRLLICVDDVTSEAFHEQVLYR